MNKGYSLIEVIVSMGLVAICILLTISVFPVLMKGVKSAEHTQVGTILGQNILEDLRNVSFAQLDLYNGYNSSYTNTGYQNGVQYVENFIYNVSVSTVNSRTKDVVARVTKPPTAASSIKVELETLIFKKD